MLHLGGPSIDWTKFPLHSNRFAKISACSFASSSAWCVCAVLPRSSAAKFERPAFTIGIPAFTAKAVLMSNAREWLKGEPSGTKRMKYQYNQLQSKLSG